MFCLPRSEVNKFLDRIKSGDLNPEKLSGMTSDERREYFSEFMSPENAKHTNILFESKMLLKAQQQGIINWAKSVTGITPESRRDIISRVSKMDSVLNPRNETAFLKDLAAHKLGTAVTMEEAARISDLAKQSAELKASRDVNPSDENILAYGRSKQAFGDYLDSVKPNPSRSLKNLAVDVVNIPKSALTSILHLSAMGVQGWGMISTDRFWQASVEQLKYFSSEQRYKDAEAMITGHPDYDTAKAAGLSLTSIDKKLNDREEAIQSSLVQRGSKWLSDKTGLPDLVRASSRAFTGFLNYVRFNRFEDLLNAARLKGEDTRPGSQVTKDLAKVVNNFTGRGDLPFGLDHSTAALNTLFFSPRKIMASVSMFNPVTYLDTRTSPTARMAALRQITGSLAVTGAVIGLARLSGASVNLNPTSTDFGKIKVGKTSFDMTGGNANYARLLARLVTGKTTSASGKTTVLGSNYTRPNQYGGVSKTGFKAPTRADETLSFLRSHLSPVAAGITDWMVGTNMVGEPVTLKSEAKNELEPIVLQDYVNLFENDPHNAKALLPALSAMFGVNMYSEPDRKPGKHH